MMDDADGCTQGSQHAVTLFTACCDFQLASTPSTASPNSATQHAVLTLAMLSMQPSAYAIAMQRVPLKSHLENQKYLHQQILCFADLSFHRCAV